MTTYIGKPCINCSATLRYDSNSGCVACVKAAAAKRIDKNREEHYTYTKARHKERYHNEPEYRAKMNAYSAKWGKEQYANNPVFRAMRIKKAAEWQKVNRERHNATARAYYWRMKAANE